MELNGRNDLGSIELNGSTLPKPGLATENIFISSNPIRGEAAQEILENNGGFIEKWSLVIFFGIIISLIGISWVIKYPDVIDAPAILTSSKAPKEIIPLLEGRLVKLYAQNNSIVRIGDVLGLMESNASTDEVLLLSNQLNKSLLLLDSGHYNEVSATLNVKYENLGEIQQDYQSFTMALQDFNDYLINGYYLRKIDRIKSDIGAIDQSTVALEDEKKIVQQDLHIAEESYNMNKKLYDEKVISLEEFRTDRSKILNKQLSLPQLQASITANDAQKRQKMADLDQISHDVSAQTSKFREGLQSLISQISEWKRRHLLLAPIAGKLNFAIPLQEQQYLQANKAVAYVLPDENQFYMVATLPQANFGKIDTGLKVQIRFDAYPYEENGFVQGTLSDVSGVPSDSGFLAQITLPQGLVTINNKQIVYKSGLKAQALIITRNIRLLDRIWMDINRMSSVKSK